MSRVKQDYERATNLIKQGKLQEARKLLAKHEHPKVIDLRQKVDIIIRAKSAKRKGHKRQKKTPFLTVITVLLIFIMAVFIIPRLNFISDTLTVNSIESEVISPTIPPNVTPQNPQTAFAAIAPQTRNCLEDNCNSVTVYQSDSLILLGIAEGDLVEGSTGWYFVESNSNRFFIHENSITFRDATPIVPTVDWRQEVQPVYYGDDNTNTSRTNNNSSSQPQYSCSGNQYNCSSFSTCSQMRSYFTSCPGDPSNLDGDNDGIPCEAMC